MLTGWDMTLLNRILEVIANLLPGTNIKYSDIYLRYKYNLTTIITKGQIENSVEPGQNCKSMLCLHQN